MKKRVIFAIIIVIITIVIIGFVIKNNITIEDVSEEVEDYTPAEEISDEQLRQTILTLYFLNIETSALSSEGRLVDSNTLLDNPYLTIVQALLDGPQSEDLVSVFPADTEIIEAGISKGCVTLNFSEEILNYTDDTQQYNIINSILNSLVELTEVDSIKILVNGETTEDFSEEYAAIY